MNQQPRDPMGLVVLMQLAALFVAIAIAVIAITFGNTP